MTTLADAIIEENIEAVRGQLQFRVDLNQLDEYGFTPLIEAAIADNVNIAKLLLQYGADANLQDAIGGTALHWAAENNNYEFVKLLLENGANPNAYNFAGQPVLVMPLLRNHDKLKDLLIQGGADLNFAQDYTNAKLLGHIFELVGFADIVDVDNNFIELDFEGFFLEFSLATIGKSVADFNNHFAARHLRKYRNYTKAIVDVINRAAILSKYQQYMIDIKNHKDEIDNLLSKEPIIMPVGYEGHAITFIKAGDILIKCDRREDSRLYDNIMIYKMLNPARLDLSFIKEIIFEKQSGDFINHDLHNILDLQPITEIKVPAQISGNCSWANVEACIPALFFIFFSTLEDFQNNISKYKNMSLNYFNQWRDWNKSRALDFCITSYKDSDTIRKACKAEILVAILFQSLSEQNPKDRPLIDKILKLLLNSEYEYVIKNYVKSYGYEDQSEEGKAFLELLRRYGLSV